MAIPTSLSDGGALTDLGLFVSLDDHLRCHGGLEIFLPAGGVVEKSLGGLDEFQKCA